MYETNPFKKQQFLSNIEFGNSVWKVFEQQREKETAKAKTFLTRIQPFSKLNKKKDVLDILTKMINITKNNKLTKEQKDLELDKLQEKLKEARAEVILTGDATKQSIDDDIQIFSEREPQLYNYLYNSSNSITQSKPLLADAKDKKLEAVYYLKDTIDRFHKISSKLDKITTKDFSKEIGNIQKSLQKALYDDNQQNVDIALNDLTALNEEMTKMTGSNLFANEEKNEEKPTKKSKKNHNKMAKEEEAQIERMRERTRGRMHNATPSASHNGDVFGNEDETDTSTHTELEDIFSFNDGDNNSSSSSSRRHSSQKSSSESSSGSSMMTITRNEEQQQSKPIIVEEVREKKDGSTYVPLETVVDVKVYDKNDTSIPANPKVEEVIRAKQDGTFYQSVTLEGVPVVTKEDVIFADKPEDIPEEMIPPNGAIFNDDIDELSNLKTRDDLTANEHFVAENRQQARSRSASAHSNTSRHSKAPSRPRSVVSFVDDVKDIPTNPLNNLSSRTSAFHTPRSTTSKSDISRLSTLSKKSKQKNNDVVSLPQFMQNEEETLNDDEAQDFYSKVQLEAPKAPKTKRKPQRQHNYLTKPTEKNTRLSSQELSLEVPMEKARKFEFELPHTVSQYKDDDFFPTRLTKKQIRDKLLDISEDKTKEERTEKDITRARAKLRSDISRHRRDDRVYRTGKGKTGKYGYHLIEF